MKLKNYQISYLGGIIFLTGLILILISWYYSYPIYMPDLGEKTFTQFYPSIWPGILCSVLGLFLAGYYSEKKNVKLLCVAVFPIVLLSYIYFYIYTPTSDSAGVKAMFQVFHNTGINTSVDPYYQFPTYFTINESTGLISNIDVISIATIFFALFGILIAVYLLFYLKSISKTKSYKIAFLGVIIYFTGIFFNLNYQWVPQTLAFIFFLLLLYTSSKNKFEYQLLSIILFTALVFTHLFIPAIFLVFFGIYSFKVKESRNIFLLMACVYTATIIYHATFYPPVIVEAFRDSVYGVGGDYATTMSQSFNDPVGITSQILSAINRVRVPLTWMILALGCLFLWIKKKMNYSAIALGLSGGIYFGIGLFYPVLGTRSLQVLFIPLVLGLGFFLSKWKKPTLILITILLVLSLSGPMREAHDAYMFQIEEEEHACNFLATTIPPDESIQVTMSGLNSGYFLMKLRYSDEINNQTSYVLTLVPRNSEFYDYFNTSIEKNTIVMYNPNLGKELISYGLTTKEVKIRQDNLIRYNKVFASGKTVVVVGG